MNFEELNDLVIHWAADRKIFERSNSISQAVKTLEELSELFQAINEKDRNGMVDAYGDILVTLIIGAKLSNINIVDALEHAYNEIKDRKGRMVDGMFVKD